MCVLEGLIKHCLSILLRAMWVHLYSYTGGFGLCGRALAVSAAVHIYTNLFFILLRRFGISDFIHIVDGRMIMMKWKVFRRNRGLIWLCPGTFLECVWGRELPTKIYSWLINFSFFFFLWLDSPIWAWSSSFRRGFTITLRHTTVGTTPLDEGPARRRDLYLTTHTRNRTSMATAGLETAIPASELLQTDALDRAATRIGLSSLLLFLNLFPLKCYTGFIRNHKCYTNYHQKTQILQIMWHVPITTALWMLMDMSSFMFRSVKFLCKVFSIPFLIRLLVLRYY